MGGLFIPKGGGELVVVVRERVIEMLGTVADRFLVLTGRLSLELERLVIDCAGVEMDRLMSFRLTVLGLAGSLDSLLFCSSVFRKCAYSVSNLSPSSSLKSPTRQLILADVFSIGNSPICFMSLTSLEMSRNRGTFSGYILHMILCTGIS